MTGDPPPTPPELPIAVPELRGGLDNSPIDTALLHSCQPIRSSSRARETDRCEPRSDCRPTHPFLFRARETEFRRPHSSGGAVGAGQRRRRRVALLASTTMELGRSMMMMSAGAARPTGSSTTDRKICSTDSGSQAVAQAEPDGYTLLLSGIGSQIIDPVINQNGGIDTMRDFTHIAYLGGTPFVFVVHPSLGINNFKDFISLLKNRKDSVAYASPGPGTFGNLLAELLAKTEQLNLVNKPTGTSVVFHVKLLAECFAEWAGNDARPDIRVAARRIWHDDANWSRRPISRLGAKDREKRGGPNNRPEDETNFPPITVHCDLASSTLPKLPKPSIS